MQRVRLATVTKQTILGGSKELGPHLDHSLFTVINVTGITLLLAIESRSQVFRQVLRDPRRMRRNLAYLVVNLAVVWALHRIGSVLPAVLPHPTWSSSWSASLWLQLPLVFLLAELFNWALHWAKHKNAFLWRLHCQHHKEDHYTVWLVTHTYGPEVLLSGSIMTALIIGAGFNPAALDVYLVFYSLVNLYQHSSLPHSLGWLDRLVIPPAYHRQHHGGEQVNFGSTLTVWDWVFRTALWPRNRHDATNPPSIDSTAEPFGFVDEMLYPWQPSRWRDTAPTTELSQAQARR
jgi:sterol desaturase/sphingolipid hydroxylase (fatty acid hydroxylase superfamily)